MTNEQKAALIANALSRAADEIAGEIGELHMRDPSLAGVPEKKATVFLRQAANHVIENGASNIYGVEGVFVPLAGPVEW